MSWLRNLKWNLLLLKLEINADLVMLTLFLIVVLIVCFIANYGLTRLEHSWANKEAVKWNQKYGR